MSLEEQILSGLAEKKILYFIENYKVLKYIKEFNKCLNDYIKGELGITEGFQIDTKES